MNIVWFRQDLRLFDNVALTHACEQGDVLPVYILDDVNSNDWKMGGASRVWLHYALHDLNNQLNGRLLVYKGDASEIISKLAQDTNANGVVWGRCYEPWRIKRDTLIKEKLTALNIEAKSFNNSLLWEPWEINKNDGTPYKVFTPFYRKGCLSAPSPRLPVDSPEDIQFYSGENTTSIDALELLPQTLDWHEQMLPHWEINEAGAQNTLDTFIENAFLGYKKKRDIPALQHTSRLAPYLHFGQISPFQVWHQTRHFADANNIDKDMDHFCSELGWREFSNSLLYHNQDLPQQPLQEKFKHFEWGAINKKHLHAWKTGNTGYPIIDAGMRELWQTGYMHNRVRMIVASFLIKNLLIPWQEGQDHFWDCLFDADLANNAASWQWVAGCGADAAPYFRIFNPVTQGEKFDPEGDYIRQYVPEIKSLPNKYIHKPWMADHSLFSGTATNYPQPIVDLKSTRERALERFAKLKEYT